MQLGEFTPDGVPTTTVKVAITIGRGAMATTVEQQVTVALHDLANYPRLVDDFAGGLLPHLFAEIEPAARTAFHNHCDDMLGAQHEAAR